MGLSAIRNIDHVVLLCRDLAAMRAFYRDILGLPLETDLERWVSFRIGSGLLSLRLRGPMGDWHHDGPAIADAASVQLAFRVPPAEIEACHEELRARNVPIASPPRDLPSWRHRTLFFRDPEGNLIEIYAEV